MRNIANVSVLALSVGLISACGGGGGGSSPPPPPPPPPPTNTAPVADIATPDGVQADELQTLSLDASASSDADGDTLSFSWQQIAGPNAVLSDPMNAQTGVALPEVSQDETLTFELSVSDGTDTTTSTVDLTVVNIQLAPLTNVLAAVNPTAPVAFKPQGITGRASYRETGVTVPSTIYGVKQDANGDGSFFAFESDGTSLIAEQSVGIGAIADDQHIQMIDSNFRSTGKFSPSFAFETDNKIRIMTDSSIPTSPGGAPTYDTVIELDIEAPCAITEMYADEQGVIIPGGIDMIVGRRGRGLSIALGGVGDSTTAGYGPFSDLVTSGAFCEVSVATLGGPERISDILAVDYEGEAIAPFVRNGPGTYQLAQPIPLNLPAGVDVVDATVQLGGAGLGGSYTSTHPHFLSRVFVLASDGQHEGHHSLLIFDQEDDASGASIPNAFTQVAEMQFPKGVPAELRLFNTDRDQDVDLLITLTSAPYAIFLENKAVNREDIPIFDEVTYFETGFDISGMAGWSSGDGANASLLFERTSLDDILITEIDLPPLPPPAPKLVIADERSKSAPPDDEDREWLFEPVVSLP